MTSPIYTYLIKLTFLDWKKMNSVFCLCPVKLFTLHLKMQYFLILSAVFSLYQLALDQHALLLLHSQVLLEFRKKTKHAQAHDSRERCNSSRYRRQSRFSLLYKMTIYRQP